MYFAWFGKKNNNNNFTLRTERASKSTECVSIYSNQSSSTAWSSIFSDLKFENLVTIFLNPLTGLTSLPNIMTGICGGGEKQRKMHSIDDKI